MKTRTEMSNLRTILALSIAGPILAITLIAWGHLCNNIFRAPDRVIVKPEKQVVTLERSDEFRVFVQNNYPAYLRNIRLTAQVSDEAVQVAVMPESVPELRAGERTAFTVKLTVAGGRAKKLPLKFGISTKEIGFRPVEEPSTQQLRDRLPSPSNYGDNILAAESLVRRNDPVGAQWLKDFMRDTKVRRDFRSRAIRALGKAGGKEQIAFLKEFLRDQDGFLKGNSLLALGCLQADLETFREFLDERDDFLRFCALAGAALAGHKEFLPQLREGLDSPDVYVRIACGWALAAHKQTEGISALEKAFATKDAMQMVMAGDALTHIAASDQM